MQPEIRQETPDDQAAVRAIHTEAFGRPGEAALVDALRNFPLSENVVSLVAVVEGRVAGHVLYTPIAIVAPDGTETPALALAPIAVAPDQQRRGIGAALIRESLARARALGHRIVVVLGHADYYPRFGFERARPLGIEAPFDVPEDVFMVQALVPGALAGVRGTVRYPEVFFSV